MTDAIVIFILRHHYTIRWIKLFYLNVFFGKGAEWDLVFQMNYKLLLFTSDYCYHLLVSREQKCIIILYCLMPPNVEGRGRKK